MKWLARGGWPSWSAERGDRVTGRSRAVEGGWPTWSLARGLVESLAPPAQCSRHRLRALNRIQGGIYMAGWLKDGLHLGGEGVGLGLEDGATAPFDLIGPVGQATEERADVLPDLRRGPKAGAGGSPPRGSSPRSSRASDRYILASGSSTIESGSRTSAPMRPICRRSA